MAQQCKNSQKPFKVNGNRVKCNELSGNRLERLCQKGKVAKKCKKQCNLCPGAIPIEEPEVCEDSTGTFKYKGESKTCTDIWYAEFDDQYTMCTTKRIVNKCKLTCGTCPPDEGGEPEDEELTPEQMADLIFMLGDTDDSGCMSKEELISFISSGVFEEDEGMRRKLALVSRLRK